MEDPKRTRVLLADDHELILEGLERLLGQRPELEIVARTRRGDDALARLESDDIDLAVLDISMPGMDGLSVISAANERDLTTRFVLLTMFEDLTYVRKAESLGVSVFLLKEAATNELLLAIDAALAGRRYLSSSLVERFIHTETTPGNTAALGKLTPAELDVLRELSLNKTSREIAATLGVSPRTVQNHRAHICAKLELRGSNRLLEFAIENRERLGSE
ncbi:MAG: response regulator transcription factor [Myxococcales bacterium]|nr:response regulator transcription factor [Myxococcales bacterium]